MNINVRVGDKDLDDSLLPVELIDEFSYDLIDVPGRVTRVLNLIGKHVGNKYVVMQ